MGQYLTRQELKFKVLTLSDSNKWALLENSRKHVIQRHAEAETLLHRLRQLNPEVAEQFQLKETALANLTLRMICSTDADIVHDPNASVSSYLHTQDSYPRCRTTPTQ
jgi:hypothetical protein